MYSLLILHRAIRVQISPKSALGLCSAKFTTVALPSEIPEARSFHSASRGVFF